MVLEKEILINNLIDILKKYGIKKIHTDTNLKNNNGRIVISEDLACRYYYSQIFEENNRIDKITIIMFNPANANMEKTDKTIDNIIRIIKKYTQYKEFEIFNLFNIRDKNPNCTKEQSIKNNLDLLKEILDLEKDNNLLIAWGNLLDKELKLYEKFERGQIVKTLFDILKTRNLFTAGITKQLSPMHLCMRNNRYLNNHLINNNGLKRVSIKIINAQITVIAESDA